MYIKSDADYDPNISTNDWIEGDAKAECSGKFILVIPNPEYDPAYDKE